MDEASDLLARARRYVRNDALAPARHTGQSVRVRMWLLLCALLGVDLLGVFGARHPFVIVGEVLASVGLAAVAASLWQSRRPHSGVRVLVSHHAALVGGIFLGLAAVLCYTFLFAGVGAILAVIGATALVKDYVRPPPSDDILVGALSIVPVATIYWLGVAMVVDSALQVIVAALLTLLSGVALAAMRRRSLAAETYHA
ncbi:MAG: hypothetical protein FD127_3066 [Acidimicrobiaceae bacterium]|nr:MAG: hypothetical protein FD127_3066 [Acidimicrobiaceae bacterium]